MFHRYAAAASVVLLALCGPASADWFDSFTGSPHSSWAFTANGSFAIDASQNYLTLFHTFLPFPPPGHFVLPPSGATIVIGEYQGAGNLFTSGRVTGTLNPGGFIDPLNQATDDQLGLVIRSTAAAGTGYSAVVSLQDGTFTLVRNDSPIPPSPGIPAFTILDGLISLPLQTDRQYQMALQAWNDSITATLTDPVGGQTWTLSATDATYSSGYGGIVTMYDPDTPAEFLLASFDNVGATTGIPEPASMVLMGLGGMGLLGYAWRRRRARAQ